MLSVTKKNKKSLFVVKENTKNWKGWYFELKAYLKKFRNYLTKKKKKFYHNLNWNVKKKKKKKKKLKVLLTHFSLTTRRHALYSDIWMRVSAIWEIYFINNCIVILSFLFTIILSKLFFIEFCAFSIFQIKELICK